MNKKAIFFTFTAVLILGVLIFLIVIDNNENEALNQINIQYTKHKAMADYVNIVRTNYLPALIQTSEKQALVAISQGAPVVNIDSIMEQEVNGSGSLIDHNLTLAYLANITFETISAPIKFENIFYEVRSIEQLDPWTIVINSTVNFEIESQSIAGTQETNITWSDNINYSSSLSLIGIYDPEHLIYITNKWQVNNSRECMLGVLDSTYVCVAIDGLCPLTGC